jgi:hypothetical protein
MNNRLRAGLLLLAMGLLAGCDLNWWHMLRAGAKSSFTTERAKIEQVLQVESDGHRFVAYVVTWGSAHVVVSDPLAKSHHREGDEIQFMAQRIELPGTAKTLNFTLLEP